jgi:opacity protein-like surface antigen
MTKIPSYLILFPALLILGTCLQAGAQDIVDRRGAYIAGSGNWTDASSELELSGLESYYGVPLFPPTSISLEQGYAAIAAVGMAESYLRGEFEMSYRKNDVSKVSIPGYGAAPSSGDMSALSFMLNGYGDIPLGKRFAIYIGGGVGWSFINLDADSTSGGTFYSINADSGALAFQGMVGLDFRLLERVHLTLGYRAWTALGIDAAYASSNGSAGFYASDNRFDLPWIHGAEIGFRFDF